MNLEIPLTYEQPITYLLDSEELDAEEYTNLGDIYEDISAIGWDTSISRTSTLAEDSVPGNSVPGNSVPGNSVPGNPREAAVAGAAAVAYCSDESPEFYTVKPQPGYIQGVVRGHQAYLITNLRNSASSCLYQPQMTWTIGRNRDAALPLRDRMLSRRHSVLMYVKTDGFYLVDLNSMNGSYVNGNRVENRISLQDGDFIRVGHTEFFFFLSTGYRKIEPIHPQVLNRLLNPEEKGNVHIDYAEIREEISFNLNRS